MSLHSEFQGPRAALRATGAVALSDGTVFLGDGAGAEGVAAGELCFNTAMTGYQEILTDPSYAEQMVCFTFPHVGNVGVNPTDVEASSPAAAVAARGAVLRAPITPASNWRSTGAFTDWLARRGVVTVTGVDTRALTRRIRDLGMPHAAVAYAPQGGIDIGALVEAARAWPGIEGAELAMRVTTATTYELAEGAWSWPAGVANVAAPRFRVTVVDFGVKRNILRRLGAIGAAARVVPADTSAEAILAESPDGVVLANGPGDPAATALYAATHVRSLVHSGTPLLGICLGHQLLALALGARTVKMPQGHHGANHPVKELATGRVEIVSMNHGFAVDRASLPAGVVETHVSLFDGTNCGLAVEGRPILSVQHHPEASPGPHDAFGTFDRFAGLMART